MSTHGINAGQKSHVYAQNAKVLTGIRNVKLKANKNIMSLSNYQLETLEHYRDIYERATNNNDVQLASAILDRLRQTGFNREAKTLLENTKLSKLITPACRSTWETDNPTQEYA